MAALESIVGIGAGVFTSISLLPQLFKMIKEKKATDISIVMLVTLLTGLAFWIWYGILKKDWPIIITNSFSLIVNVLIIALRQFYKQ
jgi:MtN3 and saliva related transmembrane protein